MGAFWKKPAVIGLAVAGLIGIGAIAVAQRGSGTDAAGGHRAGQDR